MRNRRGRAAAFVGAVGSVALVATLLVPPAAAADEEPNRVRFGTDNEERFDIPEDGGVVDTTTPTLIYEGEAADAEIVITSASGASAGSGTLGGDEWIVAEGALSAGGSYTWHAAAPTGTTTVGTAAPHVDRDANVIGEMIIGSQIVDHESVQPTQTFDVATGLGAPAAATGLRAAFFPHYDIEAQLELDEDGNPVDDLPDTVIPGVGSELVSSTGTWELFDDSLSVCPYREARQNDGGSGWTVEQWILCEMGYAIDAEARVTRDSGDAAAHNIVSDDVEPSFRTVIHSDLAVEDGFVLSTAGDNRISASFPLQTEFGFRALGYITVPETGNYTFGTQSPGGAALHVYDTTDTDLGKIEVSDPDAWWPTTLGERYSVESDRFEFENEKTGEEYVYHFGWVELRHHYEHGPSDEEWLQPDGRGLRRLTDDLRDSGPRADHVRWGQEIHLEAGRSYPIAFTGWLGPINGDIGIYVDSDATGEMPVPFEWLTAAPEGTVDFDRGFGIGADADIDGVAFAVSGHGDILASLDALGALHFYETDGGTGWRHVDSVPHLGFPMPAHFDWASEGWAMGFDDAGTTLTVALDRWPDPEAGEDRTTRTQGFVEETNGDFAGNPTITTMTWFVQDGARYSLQVTQWYRIEVRAGGQRINLWLDALDFRVDAQGRVLDGVADGRIEVGGQSHPIRTVEGHRDLATGDLQLDFVTDSGRYGVLYSEGASEPGPPSVLPDRFEVALVDKIDTDGPWHADNVDISYVNDLLEEAGLDQPWIEGEAGEIRSTYRVTRTTKDLEGGIDFRLGEPELVWDRDTGIYTLQDEFGLDLFVVATGGHQAVVTINEMWFRLGPDDTIIDGDASGTVSFSETDWIISEVQGRVNPNNGRLFLDFVTPRAEHPDWLWGMNIERTETVATTAVPHEVQITPDGNTVAVTQPLGDEHRVVVVDRNDRNDAWDIVGSFDVDHAGTMSIGRDGNTRFLALAASDEVTVQEWAPGSAWTTTATIPLAGEVEALSLDYWSEHLAIGQPAIGRVTVYERSWGSSDWAHQIDLDGAAGLGSELRYTWELLTAADHDESLVRVYRDTGYQSWSTYADWVQTDAPGSGPIPLTGTGGDPHFFRNVTTTVDVGGSYAELATHLG